MHILWSHDYHMMETRPLVTYLVLVFLLQVQSCLVGLLRSLEQLQFRPQGLYSVSHQVLNLYNTAIQVTRPLQRLEFKTKIQRLK